MQAQIRCPQCGTPFMAEVHQVVDADLQPELKQQLLSGRLNVAICPSCGAGGQLSTPLIYHDSQHELFMIFVPQEININQMQREQMIGQMSRKVMESLPPEKRKAYLFQPQTILSMQTFMEKVLETEGITKEMIERQRKQVDLLNTLMRADNDVIDYLLKQRLSEVDETFFAMLQQYLDTAVQMNDDKQLVRLTNLRAKLMMDTAVGRKLERRQIAMHNLNREAKKDGGLTPALLVKHIVANQQDSELAEQIALAGQSVMTYEFFELLTNEIDKAQQAGQTFAARHLTEIRTKLLEVQSALRQQSQQILQDAAHTLEAILQAPDQMAALEEYGDKLDDAFMYVLSANIAQAEQRGDNARLQTLTTLQSLIVQAIESAYPPEVMLLNQLMEAETAVERTQILDENRSLIQPTLLQMLEAVEKQVAEMGQAELKGRLREVKELIKTRL